MKFLQYRVWNRQGQCSFFVLFSADSEFSGGTEKYKTPVILTWTGKCSWYCPVSFTSTCPINVQYFPFDQQKCVLKFGSWTYEVKKRKSAAEYKFTFIDQIRESI